MNFDNLNYTHLFTFLAVLVSIIRYGTYLLSMYRKETKPHAFSWFNWGLVVAIGAIAQFQLNGGLSTWILALVATVCFFIAALAIPYGEKNITRSDKISFILALAIIPIWKVSNDPFIAIASIIVIDILSYYPTYRKSWQNPWEEPPTSYLWAGSRYFFTLFTVTEPTLENMAYLVFLMSIDWLFALYVFIRRRYVPAKTLAKV